MQCPQCDTPLGREETECNCGFRYIPPRAIQQELGLVEAHTTLFPPAMIPRSPYDDLRRVPMIFDP